MRVPASSSSAGEMRLSSVASPVWSWSWYSSTLAASASPGAALGGADEDVGIAVEVHVGSGDVHAAAEGLFEGVKGLVHLRRPRVGVHGDRVEDGDLGPAARAGAGDDLIHAVGVDVADRD